MIVKPIMSLCSSHKQELGASDIGITMLKTDHFTTQKCAKDTSMQNDTKKSAQAMMHRTSVSHMHAAMTHLTKTPRQEHYLFMIFRLADLTHCSTARGLPVGQITTVLAGT